MTHARARFRSSGEKGLIPRPVMSPTGAFHELCLYSGYSPTMPQIDRPGEEVGGVAVEKAGPDGAVGRERERRSSTRISGCQSSASRTTDMRSPPGGRISTDGEPKGGRRPSGAPESWNFAATSAIVP